jgi:hypothetical protein
MIAVGPQPQAVRIEGVEPPSGDASASKAAGQQLDLSSTQHRRAWGNDTSEEKTICSFPEHSRNSSVRSQALWHATNSSGNHVAAAIQTIRTDEPCRRARASDQRNGRLTLLRALRPAHSNHRGQGSNRKSFGHAVSMKPSRPEICGSHAALR